MTEVKLHGIPASGIQRIAQSLDDEKEQHFRDRTNMHIELVQKYCAKIEEEWEGFEGLIERGEVHDASKFEEPELTPYIWLTWRYKCKDDGVECELPEGMEDEIIKATKHHILNNDHHAEAHQFKLEGLFDEENEDRDGPPNDPVDASRMERLDIAEMCFTGDTKVSLLDGREVPIEDLVGRDPFWVYSCTPEGKVVPALARNVRKTRRVSAVCEVILDNGEVVRCTRDHLFMLRDGSYKEASDLGEGESLMPLYRRVSTKLSNSGYEELYHPKGRWQLTHRMVVEEVLGGYGKYAKKVGTPAVVCHHKDLCDPNNKRNNDPDNLELMTREQHAAVHLELQSAIGTATLTKLWKDPAFRERRARTSAATGKITGPVNLTKFNKSEKHRAQASERMSRLNATPVTCDLCGKVCGNAATLVTHLKCTHNLDPEYREALSERNAKVWDDPEYKKRMSAGSLKRATTPATCPVCSKVCGNKPALGYHVKVAHPEAAPLNHEVSSVETIEYECFVYDLTVDTYHNFALSSGVFVHNCADWAAMGEELGNSPRDWAEENIGVRWTFTPEQEELIYTLIDSVWEDGE